MIKQNTNIEKILFFSLYNTDKDEILKEIPDTDGKYFISNKGRVISLCQKKPRVLKPYDCGSGYSYVKINGKNKRIHRLVGQAFINNTENKPIIHHKDSNKQNNDIKNLQWVSAKENTTFYFQEQKKKSESAE